MDFRTTLFYLLLFLPFTLLAQKHNSESSPDKQAMALKDHYIENRKYIDRDSALFFFNRVVELNKSTKRKETLVWAFTELGNFHYTKAHWDTTLQFYQDAFQLCHKKADCSALTRANLLRNIGMTYQKKALLNTALKPIFQAVALLDSIESQNTKHLKLYASCYNQIGEVYRDLKQDTNALKYYYRSLEFRKNLQSRRGIGLVYSNIGIVLKNLDSLDRAMQAYYQALHFIPNYSRAMNNIGIIHLKNQYYDSAIYYFENVIETVSKKSYKSYAIATNNLAKTYLLLKNYSKSQQYFKEVAQYLTTKNYPDIREDYYENLSKLYFALGKAELGEEMAVKYHQLVDSLYNDQVTSEVAEMQTIYETNLLKKDNLLLEEQNKFQKYGLIGLAIFTLFIVVFIFFYRKAYKAEQLAHSIEKQAYLREKNLNEQLSTSNEEIKTQNEEIQAQSEELQTKNEEILTQNHQLELTNTRLQENRLELETSNLKLEKQKRITQFAKESLEHDLGNDLLNMTKIAKFPLHTLQQPKQRATFERYQYRLQAVTHFYRLLLSNKLENYVDTNTYVMDLCQSLLQKYSREDIQFELHIEVNEASILHRTQRIFADIVTELVQNMLKHAFPSLIKSPTATLKLIEESNFYSFSYQDNGKGFSTVQAASDSRGLKLLGRQADQQSFHFGNNENGGAFIRLTYAKHERT